MLCQTFSPKTLDTGIPDSRLPVVLEFYLVSPLHYYRNIFENDVEIIWGVAQFFSRQPNFLFDENFQDY